MSESHSSRSLILGVCLSLGNAAALVLVATMLLGVNAQAQCLSVSSYGGSPGATPDVNAAALTNAFGALSSSGGCIQFQSGTYAFNPVSLSYPSSAAFSLTVEGTGPDSTILDFGTNSSGITINTSSAVQTVHIRDLTLATALAGGATGLTLNNPYGSQTGAILPSDITNVDFRGDDASTNLSSWGEFWNAAVDVEGQSNINFDTDMFLGPDVPGGGGWGINLNTPSTDSNVNGPVDGIVYNISKCVFDATGNGLIIGANVEGVTVTQSNFTNGTTGIYAEAGVGSQNSTQLSVTGGNQFEMADPGTAISVQQPLSALIVSGNLFIIRGDNAGIFTNAVSEDQTTIVNNTFWQVGDSSSQPDIGQGVGINIQPSSNSPGNITGVITGNTFDNLGDGVYLNSNTTKWNVQANIYNSGVTTPVLNQGSGNAVGVATE